MKCPICGRCYTHPNSFHRHRNYECRGVEPRFPCLNCGARFRRKQYLRDHHCQVDPSPSSTTSTTSTTSSITQKRFYQFTKQQQRKKKNQNGDFLKIDSFQAVRAIRRFFLGILGNSRIHASSIQRFFIDDSEFDSARLRPTLQLIFFSF